MDRLVSIPERDFGLLNPIRQRNERQYEYRESFQSLKGIKDKEYQIVEVLALPVCNCKGRRM